MIERRTSERSRCLYAGRLAFGKIATQLDCTIRNLSETGARIEVSDALPMPDTFEVQITKRGIAYNGKMLWRHGSEIGVVFKSNSEGEKPTPIPLDQRHQIVHTQATVAALRARIMQLTEAG